MLKLILGRAGTGKTAMVIETIRARVAHCEGKNILLVPEQYSHEAERELLRRCGDTTSLYAEVLSFTRLAHALTRELGGSAKLYADRGGRALQMALALERSAGALRVYGAARRRPETIRSLLAALDELRYGCVTSERLLEAAAESEGALADKLCDLALLQNAMVRIEEESGADPLTVLDTLAENISRSALVRGGEVFVDGFTDFTAQERRVLRELWLVGDVTVCLSCDELTEGGEEFSLARRTARLLRRSAEEDGIKTEVLIVPGRADASPLSRLEERLFSYTEERFDPEGRIRLRTAPNFSAECELAAGEILRLLREEGCRYRDIAVALRGFDTRSGALSSVFARYGIPLYCTERSDILTKPLPALLLSAYEIVTGGWSYEDVFTYIKTGFAGLSREETDELENYVLLWELHGRAWTDDKPWHQHPEGYNGKYTDAAEERLARINALRKRVSAPLLSFAERTREAKTARAHCEALVGLMAELELPRKLDERAALLREKGEERRGAETLQLWEKLSHALEECARILAELPMEPEVFAKLFRLVLSELDVGTIPVAVDRVTAGDFDRMRRRSIRHLLILGADDDHIPCITSSPGLFTPPERESLRALELDVEDEDDRLDREFSLIYHVIALPADSLWISRPLFDEKGNETRPSFLIERCAKLFSLREEPGELDAARACALLPATELAAAGNAEAAAALSVSEERKERLSSLRRSAAITRGQLTARGVRTLYGEVPRLSATHIDTFASCKFQYFLRFGLKAKAREPAGFNPPELGTFLHYILENVAREVGELGGFAAVEENTVRELTRKYTAKYVREKLEDYREKSARFVYLFRRLSDTVERIVLDTANELRRSDFEPLDFELDFAKASDIPAIRIGDGEASLQLTGIADRVDGWEHDGKLYLRVTDYKTGTKKFELGDVRYGMGLQMLLYLFTLEKVGGAHYEGREIVPAGVLYVPAKDKFVQTDARPTEEEVAAEKQKAVKRSGLILSEDGVPEAMEHTDGKFEYIPVTVKKGGEQTGNALATAEQLGALSRYIEELLSGMAGELRRGSILADPLCRTETESSCTLCSYYDACHFEAERDDPRYRLTLKAPEFWAELERRKETWD